jgi:outer membrane protein assembly factor BamB
VFAKTAAELGGPPPTLGAFDVDAGRQDWTVSCPGDSCFITAAVGDGLMATSITNGNPAAFQVHEFSAGTGELRWSSKPVPFTSFDASPTADDEHVYVVASGILKAFDIGTGALAWTSANTVLGNAIRAGNVVHINAGDGSGTYLLDPATGRVLANVPLSIGVLVNGIIYAPSTGGVDAYSLPLLAPPG